jgi:hypothetical protein
MIEVCLFLYRASYTLRELILHLCIKIHGLFHGIALFPRFADYQTTGFVAYRRGSWRGATRIRAILRQGRKTIRAGILHRVLMTLIHVNCRTAVFAMFTA